MGWVDSWVWLGCVNYGKSTKILKDYDNAFKSRLNDIWLHPAGKFDFMESVISTLLKKPTLDKEELSNYRPISNLSLISKIIERVIKSRLMEHLTSNSLLNSHQSAYCKHHSTETALLYIHGFRAHIKIASRIVSYSVYKNTSQLNCKLHCYLYWVGSGWV